jgi:hypothetical protein
LLNFGKTEFKEKYLKTIEKTEIRALSSAKKNAFSRYYSR